MKQLFRFTYILCVLALASCSEDAELIMLDEEQQIENPTTEEGPFSSAELQSIVSVDELTSGLDTLLSEIYLDNGDIEKSTNDCYSVDYFQNGFTAVFNNCVLNETDNANGTLTVSYGAGSSSGSYIATFEDFFIGTVKVNGTRTYMVDISDKEIASFEISSEITLEYEDGSTVTESGTKVFALQITNNEEVLWNLQGTWTVQKHEKTYAIEGNVSTTLDCDYWSQGTMNIEIDDLAVDVDFGDGTCDDQAQVTYANGVTQTITL